jgi:hypothetical protein
MLEGGVVGDGSENEDVVSALEEEGDKAVESEGDTVTDVRVSTGENSNTKVRAGVSRRGPTGINAPVCKVLGGLSTCMLSRGATERRRGSSVDADSAVAPHWCRRRRCALWAAHCTQKEAERQRPSEQPKRSS